MQPFLGSDRHRVDPRIGAKGLVVVEPTRHLVGVSDFPGAIGAARCDGNYLSPGNPPEGSQMRFAKCPETDDANSQCIH